MEACESADTAASFISHNAVMLSSCDEFMGSTLVIAGNFHSGDLVLGRCAENSSA